MKNFFSITAFLLGTILLHAQDIKVTYNNRILIDSTLLENADRSTREKLLKDAQGENYVLIMKGGKSLYIPIIFTGSEIQETKESSGNVKIVHGYYETIYSDRKKDQLISSIKYAGETFLIQEELKPIEWEIKEDTKKIDSYIVRKAEATVYGNPVVVWFTDEIPVSGGPSYYWGLPGLVLQSQFGKRSITATKIENLPDAIAVVPPTEGKDFTREEYAELLDSQMNRKEGTTRKGNTTTTITRHR